MKKKHILKKSNTLIIILFLSVLPLLGYCQIKTLTDKDNEYLKMTVCSNMLLSTNYVIPSDMTYIYDNFYNIYKVDTLKSKGFENVFFYKIYLGISRDSLIRLYRSVKSEGSDFYMEELVMNDNSIFLTNNKYIIANITGGFYKLKGFYKNDLYDFFADCFNTGNYFTEDVINKRNLINSKNIKKQTRSIIPMLYIEEMDLESDLKKIF